MSDEKSFMQWWHEELARTELGLRRQGTRITAPAKPILFCLYFMLEYGMKFFIFINFMCGGHDGKECSDA